MPIFEFECKKCNHQFEQLVLSSDASLPVCPQCQSKNVNRLISAGSFRPHGVPTGSGGFKAPACAPQSG